MSFRLEYLHLTSVHSEGQGLGQGQGRGHFDCDYLANGKKMGQTVLLQSDI